MVAGVKVGSISDSLLNRCADHTFLKKLFCCSALKIVFEQNTANTACRSGMAEWKEIKEEEHSYEFTEQFYKDFGEVWD